MEVLTDDFMDVLRGLLTVDPDKRMTAEELHQHSWVYMDQDQEGVADSALDPEGIHEEADEEEDEEEEEVGLGDDGCKGSVTMGDAPASDKRREGGVALALRTSRRISLNNASSALLKSLPTTGYGDGVSITGTRSTIPTGRSHGE